MNTCEGCTTEYTCRHTTGCQLHDETEGSGAPPCSLCGGLTMIPSDDPDGDIMNTPCPKCNEWSPDFKENPTGQEPAGLPDLDC